MHSESATISRVCDQVFPTSCDRVLSVDVQNFKSLGKSVISREITIPGGFMLSLSIPDGFWIVFMERHIYFIFNIEF